MAPVNDAVPPGAAAGCLLFALAPRRPERVCVMLDGSAPPFAAAPVLALPPRLALKLPPALKLVLELLLFWGRE